MVFGFGFWFRGCFGVCLGFAQGTFYVVVKHLLCCCKSLFMLPKVTFWVGYFFFFRSLLICWSCFCLSLSLMASAWMGRGMLVLGKYVSGGNASGGAMGYRGLTRLWYLVLNQ